jgi:hypothetical protein
MAAKSIPWSRLGAEFVVIFLGITLSLIADDWRSQRELRAAEQMALEGFRADLQADSLSMADTNELYRAIDRSTVWIRRNLDDPAADPDTALMHMRQLGYQNPFRPQLNTWAGLRAAGQLEVIRDPALREGLVVYYEQGVPRALDTDFFDLRQRQYVDVLFDHALTPLADTATTSWAPSGLVFTTSWDAFRSDPRVEPAVTLVGIGAGGDSSVIDVVQMLNARLRAALDSAIAR